LSDSLLRSVDIRSGRLIQKSKSNRVAAELALSSSDKEELLTLLMKLGNVSDRNADIFEQGVFEGLEIPAIGRKNKMTKGRVYQILQEIWRKIARNPRLRRAFEDAGFNVDVKAAISPEPTADPERDKPEEDTARFPQPDHSPRTDEQEDSLDLEELKRARYRPEDAVMTSELNSALSALTNGVNHNMNKVSKLLVSVPAEVLMNSPDITLTFKKLNELKGNTPFELIVTGVAEEDIEMIESLKSRKDIRGAFRLPANFKIIIKTEETIKSIIKHSPGLGYDASTPAGRARVIKDMYMGRLGDGEYMAIATDGVDDAGKDEVVSQLEGEATGKISIRVLVNPVAGESVFSLSGIINDCLKDIREDGKSIVGTTSPTPSFFTEKLERATREVWRLLASA